MGFYDVGSMGFYDGRWDSMSFYYADAGDAADYGGAGDAGDAGDADGEI